MKTVPTTERLANMQGVITALRNSMHRAFASSAPANDAKPATPPLSKSVAKAVEIARLHLQYGNPGAYARALAGEHRAANARQQQAIEAAIAASIARACSLGTPLTGVSSRGRADR